MVINKLSWKIGGEAGYGIMVTGLMFSKFCARMGLHIFDYGEYPSLIRGGHNTYLVRVEDEEIFSAIRGIDILVALNQETINLHKDELFSGGAIIYDSNVITEPNAGRNDVKLIAVPLSDIATKIAGDALERNTVALGCTIALVDGDFDILKEVIADSFGKKGSDIIDKNVQTARAGYDFIKNNFKEEFKNRLQRTEDKKKMVLTGNEAMSLGAIKAGCKLVAIYPMTPISSILQVMALQQEKYNIIVKQPEDEIAAVNMAIGANFNGARAMTATSGGGFCLMVEGLGLSGMTETPLVVIEGQRPGPSTGLPTWTDQGDLKFVINSSHGEFPRIVISPGDVDECFYTIFRAFNLAEKYQLPVIVMTDKLLAESHKSTYKFDVNGMNNERYILNENETPKDYKRFNVTDSGISPRALPGMRNSIFLSSSDEHNEHGYFFEEKRNRIMMMDKRFRKLSLIENELPLPKLYGDNNSEITIVAWGSVKYPALEAIKWLKKEGIKVNLLHFVYLWPFPKRILDMLKKCKKTVLIENNKTAQFGSVVKEQIGYDFNYKFLKYDGRPFFPEEIYNKIKELLNK